MAAENIAGEGVEFRQGGAPQVALDGEAGARRAEEIARIDGQRQRPGQPNRRIRQGQGEVDPLRQEILDQESLRGEHPFLFEEGLDPPCPARRGIGKAHAHDVAARARLGGQHPAVFHPVRPHEAHRQGQALKRVHPAVAGEDRGVHRLARAVGASIGGQEYVDGGRSLVARHATVRQVELRLGQRQEGEIVTLAHGHERRRAAAGPRGQAGIEAGMTLRVGRGMADDGVRARQKRDLRPLDRGRVRKAAHDDIEPVRPAQARHAEIGDHEPLRRRRMVVGVKARHRRLQRVDARSEIAHHAVEGQQRGHVAVHFHRDIAGAGPDLLGDFRLQVLARPLVEGPPEIIGLDGADQVPVGDAQQRQVELFGIHRLDRDAALTHARQHIGAAGKAGVGAAVADILGDRDVLRQRLAVRGGQSLAEGQRVALAVLDPADADLAARGIDGEPAFGQLHEGRIVGARGDQVGVERRADARAGAVAVHLGFDDAKAVLADRVLEGGLGIVARLERLRQPQRRDHVATAAGDLEGAGERGERGRADRFAVAPQIGVDRGGGGSFGIGAPVVFVRRRSRQKQIGIVGPEVGAVGQVDRRPGQPDRAAEIARLPGLGGRGKKLIGARRTGDMRRRHAACLRERCVEIGGPEEIDLAGPDRRPAGGTGLGIADHARDRALIGVSPRHFGFQEARIGAGVEGEGVAGGLGKACRLAGGAGRVEDRSQIRAVEIHILNEDRAAVRNIGTVLGAGRDADQRGRDEQGGEERAHREILREMRGHAGTRPAGFASNAGPPFRLPSRGSAHPAAAVPAGTRRCCGGGCDFCRKADEGTPQAACGGAVARPEAAGTLRRERTACAACPCAFRSDRRAAARSRIRASRGGGAARQDE